MKWANPYDWVYDKIFELWRRAAPNVQEAPHQLRVMAMRMAAELSHDQLENLFLTEMTGDGYFGKPEDRYKELLSQGWDRDAAAHQVDFEYGFEEVG